MYVDVYISTMASNATMVVYGISFGGVHPLKTRRELLPVSLTGVSTTHSSHFIYGYMASDIW